MHAGVNGEVDLGRILPLFKRVNTVKTPQS